MAILDPLAADDATSLPYDFVRNLLEELRKGEVQLPSFPDIALRVQKVLEDERSSAAQIAKVVGADAALAAQILRIANSSVFNPTGNPVTTLQAAVGRLGNEMVRCAATSFALRQLKFATTTGDLRGVLQEMWRKGALVAALGYVIARETKVVRPDEALVTGLLHNVGRLYLLVRAQPKAALLASSGKWDQIVVDWHPRIGRGILEHWKFHPDIVAAVADQNAWDRLSATREPLTDVLIAATSLVPCVYDRDLLDDTVKTVAAFGRLCLTTEACRQLLISTAAEIKVLGEALTA